MVAVAGVALATAAMICTLSVFNGFKELVAKQFTSFDPDIKITIAVGKSFDINNDSIVGILKLPFIETATPTIEDKVMVQYNGRQTMAIIKGVADNFTELADIENILIGNGKFKLHDSTNSYAIPGGELISTLNSGIYFVEPLEIYAPRRVKKVSITNPAANFRKGFLHSSGLIFITNQTKYDAGYILTSLSFAKEIFGRKEGEITSLELRLKKGTDISEAKNEIKKSIGNDFYVHDRYEQQEDIFKIMEIEKFISYIFLSFILMIACFNIIGSLSMLIIEKREDTETLRNLGANDNIIINIFIAEGAMISLMGAIIGVGVGIILCLIQQNYGILTFGESSNGFVVDSYPIKLIATDVYAVLITIIAIGLVTVGIPTRHIARKLLKINGEEHSTKKRQTSITEE